MASAVTSEKSDGKTAWWAGKKGWWFGVVVGVVLAIVMVLASGFMIEMANKFFKKS